MSTVLITGCDYKFGFEFARQYATNGWTVHTICLQPDGREKIALTRSERRFPPT